MSFAPDFGYATPAMPPTQTPRRTGNTELRVGINYQIVEGRSTTRLADEVNDLCAEGWVPLGGMEIVNGGEYQERCYQPMTKTVLPPTPEETIVHFGEELFTL
jgi:hypothetical protein